MKAAFPENSGEKFKIIMFGINPDRFGCAKSTFQAFFLLRGEWDNLKIE